MYDISAINALGVVRVFEDLLGVEWQTDGPSWKKCLCPFHDDQTPSFKVGTEHPHRGRCFSCDARGDVIELVGKLKELEAGEAIKLLAEQYDIPRATPAKPAKRSSRSSKAKPSRGAQVSPSKPSKPTRAAEAERVNYAAVYRGCVDPETLDHEGVRGYLDARKLSEWAIASGDVGAVVEPGAWYRETSRRYNGAFKAAGLTGLYHYAAKGIPFLLFLTRDPATGEVSGLQARGWIPQELAKKERDKIPRFITAGEGLFLFGRPLEGSGLLVLCEGPTDALSWGVAGIPALGVPGVKAWHSRYAAALEGRRVVIFGDADEAGKNARGWIKKAHWGDYTAAGVKGKDANDLLKNGGPSALQRALELAKEQGAAEEEEAEPLWELIESLHWVEGNPKRLDSVKPTYRLTDAVVEWILERGGRFLRDSNEAAWLYFRKKLYRVDVKSGDWRGWLRATGRINLAEREGKIIATDLEQYAQAMHERAEPRPWIWFDRRRLLLALHLHDAEDRVVHAKNGRVEIILNGERNLLLEPDAQTLPIHPPARFSAVDALKEIDHLICSNLATQDPELVVCWALSLFMRQSIGGNRALLFAQGAAGSGKSEAAKLVTTLVYGAERLIVPTTAALYEEARNQPLIALDNQEAAQMDDELSQFLLLSATGAVRKKRDTSTTRGIVDQPTDSLVMVTAIEPPAKDELIQRTLTVRFEHELHSDTYRSTQTMIRLEEARGRIMAGLVDFFALHILPRIDELPRFDALVPSQHPKRRSSPHLALIALIADTAHQIAGIWRPGADLLKSWLHSQAEIASEVAQGTDPIVEALDNLQWGWNRVGLRSGGYVRLADADALYRCKPAFAGDKGPTPNPSEATKTFIAHGVTYPEVVGFFGSYADLHADLCSVSKDYTRKIASASHLSARWKHNPALKSAGWGVTPHKRSNKGRTYFFGDTHSTTPEGIMGGVTPRVSQ